jgi:hypothetical protein
MSVMSFMIQYPGVKLMKLFWGVNLLTLLKAISFHNTDKYVNV